MLIKSLLFAAAASLALSGTAQAIDFGDRVENRLDRKGEQIDRRNDRRGAKADRRNDRRGKRINNRL